MLVITPLAARTRSMKKRYRRRSLPRVGDAFCSKGDASGGGPGLRDLQAWLDQGTTEDAATQAREAPRQFVNRDSHYLGGRRHLMTAVYRDTKPGVALDHKRITLTVRRAAMPHSALR
jgi:hypothetical protein